MNIEITDAGSYKIAVIDGVIDEESKQAFDEKLHTSIADEGKNLILDMSQCLRITSAGIGHMVTLVSRANTKGSSVVLASPSPFVKSILSVTKLTKFFDVTDNLDEAKKIVSG